MSSHEIGPIHHTELDVQEARPQLQEPSRYQVILLNDDYTPMEFVVELLRRFFQMDGEQATEVMLHVHTRGKGVCGTFSHEIAETKVAQVNDYAREHQHPLVSSLERI